MYGTFDKQLELRDISGGAVTTTTSESGVTLPVRSYGDYKAVVHISAIDTANADET